MYKIKLIHPSRIGTYDLYGNRNIIYLPYGMGVLTSYLRSNGIYVEQQDLSVKLTRKRKWVRDDRLVRLYRNKPLSEDISKFFATKNIPVHLEEIFNEMLDSIPISGFDIIGFSIFTLWHFLVAIMLSSRIKKWTNTPIVFGGPFITLYGQLYPHAFEFIDFMIVGEGEQPLRQLVHSLGKDDSFKKIPGIVYKQKDSLIVCPRARYSIEKMPIPDFEGLPLGLYDKSSKGIFLPYQISKGCNGTCNFCRQKHIYPFLEYKSYSKVINDLQELKKKYKSSLFHICDSSVNSSVEYLEGLCNAFVQNKIRINWRASVKIGNIDRQILEKMKLSGCKSLFFGIESGSDRILGLMQKGFTAGQAQHALRMSAELGLENICSFVSGYIHEQQRDIMDTIYFIRKNKKFIDQARLHSFILLHGSDIWEYPQKYNISNLRTIRPIFVCAFDENNGLSWTEKRKQQDNSNMQIKKAIKKHLIYGKLFHKLMHLARLWFSIRQ